MKTGDILEYFDGTFYEVIEIISVYKGIYRFIGISESGKKEITYSYFFKGYENQN